MDIPFVSPPIQYNEDFFLGPNFTLPPVVMMDGVNNRIALSTGECVLYQILTRPSESKERRIINMFPRQIESGATIPIVVYPMYS